MRPAAPVPHVVRARPTRSWLGRALERAFAPLLVPLALLGAMASFLASKAWTVGVITRQEVRSGTGQPLRQIASQYFVAGITERGRTGVAVPVDSLSEFESEFGARVSYGFLTDDLAAFFAEGGTRAHVVRNVGASATLGTRTLVDRAGSPLNTVRIDAIAAGAWSARVKVAVANGTVSNTVTLTVLFDDVPVETYRNQANPTALVAAINAHSRYITAANLGSATAAPSNNPAVLAAAALSSGADDRASVTASTLMAAINAVFTADLGPGAIAIPGYPASDIATALLTHADTNNRVALMHGDPTNALADVRTDAQSFSATNGNEAGGILWPFVRIPDPDQADGTITVPPTGFAAAVRARAIEGVGPHQAPAGDDFQSRYITSLATTPTTTEVNDATDGNVIPIKQRTATTVELYGYRSLSTDDEQWRELSGRDTMNALAWDCEEAAAPFAFRAIDGRGQLRAGLESRLTGVAERYAKAGALFPKIVNGEQVDPGYSVSVTEYPSERRVEAIVAARVSETAELVVITVVKVAATAAV